jgi:hypothetical protein
MADNSQQKHQNSDKFNEVSKSVNLKIKLKSPFFTFQGLYLSKALLYCHIKYRLFDIGIAFIVSPIQDNNNTNFQHDTIQFQKRWLIKKYNRNIFHKFTTHIQSYTVVRILN